MLCGSAHRERSTAARAACHYDSSERALTPRPHLLPLQFQLLHHPIHQPRRRAQHDVLPRPAHPLHLVRADALRRLGRVHACAQHRTIEAPRPGVGGEEARLPRRRGAAVAARGHHPLRLEAHHAQHVGRRQSRPRGALRRALPASAGVARANAGGGALGLPARRRRPLRSRGAARLPRLIPACTKPERAIVVRDRSFSFRRHQPGSYINAGETIGGIRCPLDRR